MRPLVHARRELRRAQLAIESMRSATTLDTLEEGWISFLRHLERTWNKAQAQLKMSSKFQGWLERGRVETLRGQDPLLAYLRNARGADEHGIEDIADKRPGGIGIGPAEGSCLYIEEMVMTDGVIRVKSPDKLRVTIEPPKLRLVPVTNRGVRYEVPTSHLDSEIRRMDPISLAEMGHKFYAGFLDVAEKEFVK